MIVAGRSGLAHDANGPRSKRAVRLPDPGSTAPRMVTGVISAR